MGREICGLFKILIFCVSVLWAWEGLVESHVLWFVQHQGVHLGHGEAAVSQAGAQSRKGNLEELPGRTSPASVAVGSWISELMWSAWSNKSIQKQFWFTGLLFVLAFLFLSCLQWGLEFHKAEDNSLSLSADLVQFWLSPMSESQGQVVHVLGNPAPLWWISVGYWGDPIKCFLAQGELGSY